MVSAIVTHFGACSFFQDHHSCLPNSFISLSPAALSPPPNMCYQGHSCRMKALYRVTHPARLVSQSTSQPIAWSLHTHTSRSHTLWAPTHVITFLANNSLVRCNNEPRNTTLALPGARNLANDAPCCHKAQETLNTKCP